MKQPIKQIAASMALALAALAIHSTPTLAAEPNAWQAIPDAGLEAETEGRWSDAAAIYRAELQRNPRRADLWLRIADIEAELKRPAEAGRALEQAAQLLPQDASVWFRLSQARAVAGDKRGAFDACGHALNLQPNNLEFLRSRSELALWIDNRSEAIAINERIQALAPNDPKATLALARIRSWTGALDQAVKEYGAYLQKNPDDKIATIELIKIEGWRGNYPDALDLLEEYRRKFGDDRSYQQQRARALAWQGKPTPALGAADRLLKETPADAEALTTRIIALQATNRTREALADLDRLKQTNTSEKEIADLSRYLKTPLRSNITLSTNYNKDSDNVRIQRLTLDGEYVLNPETRFIYGAEGQSLTADLGSGMEHISGAHNAMFRSGWIGVKHRFNPGIAGDVRIGDGKVAGRGQSGLYRAGLEFNPSDAWWWRPEVERDLFAVSPRAASVQVMRESLRLNSRWTPDTRHVIDMAAAYSDLSDGNRYWELGVAPRRAILRNQSLNMDLGLSARWFGYRNDFANGYYDPNRYQRYAITNFNYWKLNDNNGISLAVSLGLQKDNTMSNFKVGGDAVLQGFFGIYNDWYLRAYTSLLHNTRDGSGAYRGSNVGAALTRRF